MASSSSSNFENSVKKIYDSVIDEVVSNIREAFLDDGYDDQLLMELKHAWETKLNSSRAIGLDNNDSINLATASAKQSHQHLSSFTTSKATVLIDSRRLPTSQSSINHHQQQHNSPRELLLASNSNEEQPHHYHSHSHSQHISSILTQQQQQQRDSIGDDIKPIMIPQPLYPASAFVPFPSSSASSAQPSFPSHHRHHHHHSSKGSGSRPPPQQLDGHIEGGGISSDDEDDDDDDIPVATHAEDDADKDAGEGDEEGEEGGNEGKEDPDPLNSEDDLTSSDSNNSDLFDTDHVIVCQYDKITRIKNRWKFHLRDGIMNLNGKDILFSKATGDAEW